MRRRRSLMRFGIPLGAALATGALVFLQARAWMEEPDLSRPRYLVARRSLPAEHPLSLGDLTLGGAGAPPGTVTDQELHRLENSLLKRALSRGEWLRWEDVAEGGRLAAAVPRGMRAYGLRPANSLRVQARDRVDVWWRPVAGEAVVLVEGALVLQADRGQGGLVLALPQDDIPALEKAARQGTLTVSLRHPEDRPGARRGRRPRKPVPRKKIEIWTEAK